MILLFLSSPPANPQGRAGGPKQRYGVVAYGTSSPKRKKTVPGSASEGMSSKNRKGGRQRAPSGAGRMPRLPGQTPRPPGQTPPAVGPSAASSPAKRRSRPAKRRGRRAKRRGRRTKRRQQSGQAPPAARPSAASSPAKRRQQPGQTPPAARPNAAAARPNAAAAGPNAAAARRGGTRLQTKTPREGGEYALFPRGCLPEKAGRALKVRLRTRGSCLPCQTHGRRCQRS